MEALGGIGYRFDWIRWCSPSAISYDMSAGKPVQNMNLTGSILTFNWRWRNTGYCATTYAAVRFQAQRPLGNNCFAPR